MNTGTIPSLSRIAALLVASVGGIGYIPLAPGTFGSAAGLALWALIPRTTLAQLTTIAGLFAIGSWSGGVAERHFGRADPGQVVIDEVLGMLITLFLNPVAWPGAAAGFPSVAASQGLPPIASCSSATPRASFRRSLPVASTPRSNRDGARRMRSRITSTPMGPSLHARLPQRIRGLC